MLELEVVRNLVIGIPIERKIVSAYRHAGHIEVGTDTGSEKLAKNCFFVLLASVFKEVHPSSLNDAKSFDGLKRLIQVRLNIPLAVRWSTDCSWIFYSAAATSES